MQVIYGHRGASAYAPENTLEAFELAAKMGAYGVELDVQIAKDGELVVAHDETIERVSNGCGYIQDYSTAELKKFRFNKIHPEYENATIPTLREVFELLKPYGLHINVELKNSRIFYKNLEEKCVKLAYETGMTDRIFYSSFNHYSMIHMKEIDASLPCGLLYDATLIRPWTYAKELGMNAIHPHFSELLIAGECAETHKLGLSVNIWTVNTEEELRFTIAAGADRIISNYPDRALKVLKEMTE